jgi:Ca2+-transporting ATPase
VRPLTEDWHTLSAENLGHELKCEFDQGLDKPEARRRLEQHGPNQLKDSGRRPLWHLLLKQFSDFMILVLLAAALISGFIGELVDTIAILVIITLNAVIGAVQEFRAERAIAALKAMAAPTARVRRQGRVQVLPSAELVPDSQVHQIHHDQ